MLANGIGKIDLVIMNLYPFADTGLIINCINLSDRIKQYYVVASHANDFDMCIENIDIGGPSMLR